MECVLATISGRTVELQDMDNDLEHRCPHVFDLGVFGNIYIDDLHQKRDLKIYIYINILTHIN